MNNPIRINPAKLLLSKWTAVHPLNKEKHFLVTKIIRDERENIVACILEAVHSRRAIELDWQLLKNGDKWLMGWR